MQCTDESRNWEEVLSILGHAKLQHDELKPLVQCMSFVKELDNDSVKLLEVDEDVVQCLTEGQTVVLRGSKMDSATLCTGNKTYEVREAETTNLLLLVPHLCVGEDITDTESTLAQCKVIASKQEYYELRHIKPRLMKLKSLLSKNLFSGLICDEDEHHIDKPKYCFEELLDDVQASEQELLQALKDMHACQIQGHWRLLDTDYIGEVLNSLLGLKDEHSWSIDKIPLQECCDNLEDLYPRNVVKHVLQCYSDTIGHPDRPNEDPVEGEAIICKLNEDKVCRFYAELLLKSAVKFNMKEFVMAWQMAVPEGLKTGLYQLDGLALIDRDSSPEVIKHFPASDLSENINERFETLFKARTKWTVDEITPYVKDLATSKLSVGALLTKHARASTQNGKKVYSSKKPIA